jgi:hypothetical protein
MARFNITTVLGYSAKKEYIGSLNFRNIITLTVETLHRTNTDPRYNLSNLSEYDAPDIYKNSNTPIVLNDVPFGVGRIVSVSEPRSAEFDENGLQFWKRIITFELYENGDNSSIPNNTSNPFYARLRDNLFNSRVSQISEEYSFVDGEDGNLGYTQTVNVVCIDEVAENSPSDNTKTGVYLARQIAQNLIESEVNFGYLGNLNNLYGKAGRNIYSSDVDVINGSVSITKTFTPFLIRTPASYSFAVTADGSIEISESITLTNKNLATSSSNLGEIISILDNLKSSSYSRCEGYFNAYKDLIKNSTQEIDTIQSSAINLTAITRSFDEKNQQYEQVVTYSNGRNLRSYYLLQVEQSIRALENGFLEITEVGGFVNKKSKIKSSDSTFLGSNYFDTNVSVKSLLESEQKLSLNRAQNAYTKYFKNNALTPSLKLISSSRSASIRGKGFNYSVTYTNDPTIVKNSDNIIKLNSNISAVLPKKLSSPYVIPNNKQIFVQFNNQSTVGTMTIAQTALIKRINANKTPDLVNKPTSIIKKLYSNCLISLINRIVGFGKGSPNNFVIKEVSYSYNSSREVRVSVSIDYLVAANYAGPQSNLYQN